MSARDDAAMRRFLLALALLPIAAAPAAARIEANKPYCGGDIVARYFFNQQAFGFPGYQVTLVNTTNRRLRFSIEFRHRNSGTLTRDWEYVPGQVHFMGLGFNMPSDGGGVLPLHEVPNRVFITCR